MDRFVASAFVAILLIACSKPAEEISFDGKWVLKNTVAQLYGISSIDQAFVDDSAPIPKTLKFSIPDDFQFNHVDITTDRTNRTIDLVDDIRDVSYRLILIQRADFKEIRFYLRDTLYNISKAAFTFQPNTATISIDSSLLRNEFEDTILISGSVVLPYQSLEAGKLTFLQTPHPDEFKGVLLDTIKLWADQMCELSFHTPAPSLPQQGTWEYSSTHLRFELENGIHSFPYGLTEHQLILEAAPTYLSDEIVRLKESEFGLISGSLDSVRIHYWSEFERFWWEPL